MTSSVSGKRATAAPIAPMKAIQFSVRWRRDSNPCKRLCRPVPSRSATPPCGLTPRAEGLPKKTLYTRADDETRTRDPNLGKVVRYQLRYIRISFPVVPGTYETLADDPRLSKPEANLARVSPDGHHSPYASGSIVSRPPGSWAIGAVGSALPSHGRGHRFESGIAHGSQPRTSPRRSGASSSPPSEPRDQPMKGRRSG